MFGGSVEDEARLGQVLTSFTAPQQVAFLLTMKRFFNDNEKKKLFLKAGGLCEICKSLLTKGWHADHIIPFSLGGQTVLKNGQALCSKCNLSKSNKMKKEIQLREWQQKFYKLPKEAYGNHIKRLSEKKHFLLSAGVGSGKTIASIYAALEFDGFNFLIISPSQNVRDKWAKEFKIHAGIEIDHDYTFKYHFQGNYRGISITYQSLNQDNIDFLLRSKIINEKTLLILDEIHHAGEDENKSWGPAINRIGDAVGFVLTLTGTPTRSDNFRIPFCTYEGDKDKNLMEYKLLPDFTYDYADSVRDKVCCPISFTVIDVLSEKTKEGYIDRENKDHNSAYVTIFDQDEFISSAFKMADKTLNEYREGFMENAAGLVVCHTQEQAKRLHSLFPEDSVVITSDENTSKDIEFFSKKSNKKWVFAVKMISEGVDIPRLRVILYWSRVETMLYFTQVAGRAVRNRKDINGQIDTCRFFLPNILPLVENSKFIENQIKHIIDSQKVEYKERKERGDFQKIDLFDSVPVDVFAGDSVQINMGIVFPKEVTDGLAYIPIGLRGTVERYFAENKAKEMSFETSLEIMPLTRTEQLKEIKSKISKMVFKYANLNNEEVSKVHWVLNNDSGIHNQTECEDLDALKLKLKYITKLLNN